MMPRDRILHILRTRGQQNTAEVSEALGMNKKNVESLMSRLCKAGKIERISLGIYKIK